MMTTIAAQIPNERVGMRGDARFARNANAVVNDVLKMLFIALSYAYARRCFRTSFLLMIGAEAFHMLQNRVRSVGGFALSSSALLLTVSVSSARRRSRASRFLRAATSTSDCL